MFREFHVWEHVFNHLGPTDAVRFMHTCRTARLVACQLSWWRNWNVQLLRSDRQLPSYARCIRMAGCAAQELLPRLTTWSPPNSPKPDVRKLCVAGYAGAPGISGEWSRNLHTLQLNHCSEMRSLSDSLRGLSSLRDLTVQHSPLGHLSGLAECHQLTRLRLGHCSALTHARLPGHLASTLHVLALEDCPRLTGVMGLAGMTALRDLHLACLPELEAPGDRGIGALARLERLTCTDCPRLSSLCGLGELTALRKLWLYNCPRLQRLEAALPVLTALTLLHVQGCAVSRLDLEGPARLENVCVMKCHQLCSADLRGLTRLTELQITWADQLTSLRGLHGLSSLQLMGCARLGSLRDAGLTGLAHLDLDTLPAAACTLPAHLPNLRSVRIAFCDVSEVELRGMPAMRRLELWATACLERLLSLEHMTALEELHVHGAPRLRSLDGLRCASSLRSLVVTECVSLTRLDALHLGSLMVLEIRRVPMLVGGLDLGGLTGLTRLCVRQACRLTQLLRLPASLQEVYISSCDVLARVDGLSRAAHMRVLEISLCLQLWRVDLPVRLCGLAVHNCPLLFLAEFGDL